MLFSQLCLQSCSKTLISFSFPKSRNMDEKLHYFNQNFNATAIVDTRKQKVMILDINRLTQMLLMPQQKNNCQNNQIKAAL
jgi:hypothetical protein